MKKDLYECCRCGYQTDDKSGMRKHLYKLKKPCPGSRADIEITDAIKEHILQNRVYQVPKPTTTPTYLQINNFIANMNPYEKINKYLEHKGLDLVDFDQSIEDKFRKNTKRLDRDGYKLGFRLKTQDFLEIIDEISNASTRMDEINILYDSKLNKVRLYEAGVWEAVLLESGLKKVIETIQTHYLDSYECYLIRNMRCDGTPIIRRQEYKELLEEYYKFICCFDISPYIKGKPDNMILKDRDTTDDSDFAIEEEYMPKYEKVQGMILKSEANTIKKKVLDILKRNTSHNMDELNKKIFELFQMDELFKKEMLIAKID